ncbi:50S ribosomal protein L3 [Candidatus Kaiserbacteria bacterium CG_4_9_14_3_um_filter_50_16]|uniref:50S ribosomal protein L3 n=1 Tax=Candidatus Kaiserbacteria bacterium CG17_big_fil_post_rev_8_21_14_2_50_51_7 TaxID=1974613 RepID=A0A2M7FCN3_9BACT|nr:MAG: 50S ribosomal protein L3 [Parcubacteria group bacterium CG1_02_50_68]PIU82151.1 MAG: 50S ribosomal protein L3 [Candidatus Kaiserbacteria bacterium CG06_land_8_20_14_3_00_49_31]PIV86867.1 MAG: 50S ribosomal protein L3 [Candidatus Kaiserbacteria bacterium CG17_big_fil_post_rev_8_21_14_2_50_51_7]PIW96422.1 MAG: 50S ribosomal protein L3 [Candidatus Kaiserbacteria bacterium CG_4_8_14_3_um_filter_50_23]PJA00275.1 MAG: 50S ribosomal protein L3 [Candidatus Kaiserbacteria bacterium CG_4_10_14_0_
MKFILAKKEGMTRIFVEDGHARAGTILVADPVVITQIKMKDGKDGYAAIQVGAGIRKTKNISKAVLGHTKGRGYAAIREFRTDNTATVGDTIDASVFAVGDTVQVSGLTKGKGFAGVVKRHGFHGGPRSHGQKHTERSPGSIGGSSGRAGGRVAKGMKMAGRTGADRVTITNLKVLAVDAKAGEIIVSGAVPGRRGALLEVVST